MSYDMPEPSSSEHIASLSAGCFLVPTHEDWRACIHELGWGGLHWQLFYNVPDSLALVWNCVLGFTEDGRPSWHMAVAQGDQPFSLQDGRPVQVSADGLSIDEFCKALEDAYWKHEHPDFIPVVDDIRLCQKCWYRHHAVAVSVMKKAFSKRYGVTEKDAALSLSASDEFRKFFKLLRSDKDADGGHTGEYSDADSLPHGYEQFIEALAEDTRLAALDGR